jgi:hypothetical protein
VGRLWGEGQEVGSAVALAKPIGTGQVFGFEGRAGLRMPLGPLGPFDPENFALKRRARSAAAKSCRRCGPDEP